MFPTNPRLSQQLAFLIEIDQLKRILRQTSIVGGLRRENSAEHSWHLVTMAVILSELAPAEVDLQRVLSMLAIHDIVEIDAGDTFAFDTHANSTKHAREQAAAERIFGLLPADQTAFVRSLWDEFEAATTVEARYANALDRLSALLANAMNDGGTWREHRITSDAILVRMAPIRDGAPALWPLVLHVVEHVRARGYLGDS